MPRDRPTIRLARREPLLMVPATPIGFDVISNDELDRRRAIARRNHDALKRRATPFDEALAWLRARPDDPAAARSLRCLLEKAKANHAFRLRIDRDDATGEIAAVRVD